MILAYCLRLVMVPSVHVHTGRIDQQESIESLGESDTEFTGPRSQGVCDPIRIREFWIANTKRFRIFIGCLHMHMDGFQYFALEVHGLNGFCWVGLRWVGLGWIFLFLNAIGL